MFKLCIPYKSHSNKLIWDYMTQISNQINNINLASSLDSYEASVDNIIYVIISDNTVYLYAGLSQLCLLDNSHFPFCHIWANLDDTVFDDGFDSKDDFLVFCFDIKKYNSVLSLSEDYQNRDKINIYLSKDNNKLYYLVSKNNYVDLSPISYVSKDIKNILYESYLLYCSSKEDTTNNQKTPYLLVESVDKNSFLLPFMSYKDFLNFSVYSDINKSVISVEDKNGDKQFYFNNLFIGTDNKLYFYSKTLLRKDKFIFSELFDGNDTPIPVGLWQVFVILQHYKAWKYLKYFNDVTNSFAYLFLDEKQQIKITHILKNNFNTDDTTMSVLQKLKADSIDNYELVGEMHSNELFKLNKLYSNANRTCFFDFSSQTFTGNNYIFNDNKLDTKTVELEKRIETKLPLKITFTEIKHYIGSDLSQKNFNLRVYTDGIRVMLERWNNDFDTMDCRVIFDHTLSKRNQNLPNN